MLPTLSARELVIGIFGAWRLIHFDRSGVQYFDATVEGFWKSFYAALVVLPADILLRSVMLTATPDSLPTAGPIRIALVYLVIYVLQWTLFPFAMWYLADAFSRRERFITYIVAHNWAVVIQFAIILPAALLFAAGGFGASGWGAAIMAVAILITWIYAWFVARAALDVSGFAAGGIVVLQVATGMLLDYTSDVMMGRGG